MSNPDVMSRGEPFESATASAAPTPHMDIQVGGRFCANWSTMSPAFFNIVLASRMLLHAAEFAARHKGLGRYSEARIESGHAEFNTAYLDTHRNSSQDTAERVRRSHVSVILPHVAKEA